MDRRLSQDRTRELAPFARCVSLETNKPHKMPLLLCVQSDWVGECSHASSQEKKEAVDVILVFLANCS